MNNSKHPQILQDFKVLEGDCKLVEFAKLELDFITNVEPDQEKEKSLFLFNKCVLNVIEHVSFINDPIQLNALSAKIYNIRKYVDKNGIVCDELKDVIQKNKVCYDEEIVMMGDVISYMQSEILKVLENDSFYGTSNKLIFKTCGKVVQRIVYLMGWIPLRTFKCIEDLKMVQVAGTEDRAICQSSIAGRVYSYQAFSEQPYIANGITFLLENEDGFEPFVCDESRIFVKFPLKSSHFIPTMIKINKDEKVYKLDRSKYKKLKKRIVSTQPRF